MLAYTFARLLTEQAVIERDRAPVDPYGADRTPDWREHLTVPCRLWWAKSSGARSANREHVSPQRVVPISEGGLLLHLGTDVSERDRIARILDRQGNTMIDGIMEIVAVLNIDGDHLELSVLRPHLGA